MAIAFYYGGGGVQEMSKPTSICNVEKLFLVSFLSNSQTYKSILLEIVKSSNLASKLGLVKLSDLQNSFIYLPLFWFVVCELHQHPPKPAPNPGLNWDHLQFCKCCLSRCHVLSSISRNFFVFSFRSKKPKKAQQQ